MVILHSIQLFSASLSSPAFSAKKKRKMLWENLLLALFVTIMKNPSVESQRTWWERRQFESTVAFRRLWISDKVKGGHAVTSGLEPWHSDPRHSCLGLGSLVCVPVRTCMLWSFICRSLSITAMFPEPDHLQQLKMPLQLAGSAGLWSTLHYIIKRSCFANSCKRGIWFQPPGPLNPSFSPQCSHSDQVE